MLVHCLHGEHLAPGCALERRQAVGDSGMLWALFCCPSMGCFFETRPLPQHCCCTSFHRNLVPGGCGLFSRVLCPTTKQKKPPLCQLPQCQCQVESRLQKPTQYYAVIIGHNLRSGCWNTPFHDRLIHCLFERTCGIFATHLLNKPQKKSMIENTIGCGISGCCDWHPGDSWLLLKQGLPIDQEWRQQSNNS